MTDISVIGPKELINLLQTIRNSRNHVLKYNAYIAKSPLYMYSVHVNSYWLMESP